MLSLMDWVEIDSLQNAKEKWPERLDGVITKLSEKIFEEVAYELVVGCLLECCNANKVAEKQHETVIRTTGPKEEEA